MPTDRPAGERPGGERPGGERSGMAVGFEFHFEATREEQQLLLQKMRGRHHDKSEAEVYDMLRAMAPGDRFLLLLNRHPEYDELGPESANASAAMQDPGSDNWGRIP